MLRLLADENLVGAIVEGLQRRDPSCDIVRVQDVGLLGANDRTVLSWAAENDRVLVTHDKRTIPYAVEERLRAGQAMPGVFVVPTSMSVGQVIDDIVTLAECSAQEE